MKLKTLEWSTYWDGTKKDKESIQEKFADFQTLN